MQRRLVRYAIERLLYRLSVSPHADQFLLKGAMLFSLWAEVPFRTTVDLDLLFFGESAPDRIGRVFREACEQAVADDGMTFFPDTVRVERTRAEDEYAGLRITLQAELARARLPIQIDLGFGDAVTPGPQTVDYPALLDAEPPRLRAYPPETVVAEKYQALTSLGFINTRMKDFFDLWAISETFAFDGPVFAQAIAATFARRETLLPTEIPIALTPAFALDAAKQAQWRGFLRRTEIALAPQAFEDIQRRLIDFLQPPTDALARQEPFSQSWTPGETWRPEPATAS